MPIFVYECKDCHYQFDLLRHRDKRYKMPRCPACKSRNTTRIIAQPVSLLRGPAPQPTSPHRGRPGVSLQNVRIENSGRAGLAIGPGVKVKSENLQLKNNPIGIDNAGEFEGIDTSIERHDSPSPPEE